MGRIVNVGGGATRQDSVLQWINVLLKRLCWFMMQHVRTVQWI